MNMSSAIANSRLAVPWWKDEPDGLVNPLTINLDEIREQPKPSVRWEDDAWQWELDTQCRARVFYIWSMFDYIQVLGWVEHTDDWDWWITITTTDGVEHGADCGSDFHGMIDSTGKLWDDPRKASSEGWFFDREKPVMTVLSVNAYVYKGDPDSLDGDYVEEEWRFDIDKISSITIGYDT
jgi:hypothetical protein